MESHLIISIGRQIGAGGLGVARLLSHEFGFPTVRRAHFMPRESNMSDIFWSESAPFSEIISAIMSLTTLRETLS